MLPRHEEAPRFGLGIGRERPDADRGLRFRMVHAGAVVLAVELQRLLHALPIGEEIGERVRQAEMRRELRAVVGAAQDPQLGAGRPRRMRLDRAERMAFLQRHAGKPRLQVDHLLREFVGRIRVRVQRHRGQAVRTRGAAHAQVDAARRDAFEHAELLGHLERRIVRQHHAGAAYPDALGGRADRGDQDFGRGADDAVAVVVLGHPVAVVAQLVAMLRELDALADRGALRAALLEEVDWSRTESFMMGVSVNCKPLQPVRTWKGESHVRSESQRLSARLPGHLQPFGHRRERPG